MPQLSFARRDQAIPYPEGGAPRMSRLRTLWRPSSPTLLALISGNFRGFVVDFGDLAIAVAMMGVMLYGLSLVFGDAVIVKTENDEFV